MESNLYHLNCGSKDFKEKYIAHDTIWSFIGQPIEPQLTEKIGKLHIYFNRGPRCSMVVCTSKRTWGLFRLGYWQFIIAILFLGKLSLYREYNFTVLTRRMWRVAHHEPWENPPLSSLHGVGQAISLSYPSYLPPPWVALIICHASLAYAHASSFTQYLNTLKGIALEPWDQ